MLAGVSFTGAYCLLREGAIKSPSIVDFLKALVKQIKRLEFRQFADLDITVEAWSIPRSSDSTVGAPD